MKIIELFRNRIIKITAWITASFGALATVLGFVNDLPDAYARLTNNTGSIAISYKGEKVDHIGERHVVVCMDSVQSASKLTGIYPTLSNNTSYGVNNFTIRYSIESKGVTFSPSAFYNMSQDEEGESVLKYKETILPAFTTVERPIKHIYPSETGGRMNMSVLASYDGIDNPIVYNLYTNFYVIPYSAASSYDNWKELCQRMFMTDTHDLKECDVYYLTQRNGIEQEINFNLSEITNNNNKDNNNKDNNNKEGNITHRNQLSQIRGTSSRKISIHKPVEERSTAIFNPSRLFNLLIETTDSSYVKFSAHNVKADTTIIILALLEDTVTNKKSNKFWGLKSEWLRQGISCRIDENTRVLDYTICQENQFLRDSVNIDNDSIMKSRILRTIGIKAEGCVPVILTPRHDTQSSHNDKIDLKPYRNRVIRFYDLPEELLIDKYKKVDKNYWLWEILEFGSLVFWGNIPFIIICFIIDSIKYKKREIRKKEFLEDIVVLFSIVSILFLMLFIGLLIYHYI